MKTLFYWLAWIAALLIGLAIAAIPIYCRESLGTHFGLFSIVAIICGTICFLGALGLAGWCAYLDMNNITPMETRIAALENDRWPKRTLARILTDAQKTKSLHAKLGELSANLQKKDTTDATALGKIKDFILQNFPKS